MRIAVVQFPGSNCDQDCLRALTDGMGVEAEYAWHKETSLRGADAVVLPGGFSYGDYLRCGAIARFSPIMKAVLSAAREGTPILGVCNGFQILCEAGLLPGALIRNESLHFVCRPIYLKTESRKTPFTSEIGEGKILRMPVAHGEGSYFADAETISRLESDGQVIFRYVDRSGQPGKGANPNGSLNDIAGICNEARNVVGMMPHPDRAWDEKLGSVDGKLLFASMIAAISSRPKKWPSEKGRPALEHETSH
jgi:phosphoribosylformylglycinamidine synthase subunit PurQ / glutaminase